MAAALARRCGLPWWWHRCCWHRCRLFQMLRPRAARGAAGTPRIPVRHRLHGAVSVRVLADFAPMTPQGARRSHVISVEHGASFHGGRWRPHRHLRYSRAARPLTFPPHHCPRSDRVRTCDFVSGYRPERNAVSAMRRAPGSLRLRIARQPRVAMTQAPLAHWLEVRVLARLARPLARRRVASKMLSRKTCCIAFLGLRSHGA